MGVGPDPDQVLAELGDELAARVSAAVPAWVVRCVETRLAPDAPGRDDVMAEAQAARADAPRQEVGARLHALLGEDLDAQHSTPLAVVRGAVSYPTDVLRRAQVPPVPARPVRVGALSRRSLRAHPGIAPGRGPRSRRAVDRLGSRQGHGASPAVTRGPGSSPNDHRRMVVCSRIVHLPPVPSALMTARIGSVGPDEGPGAAPIQSAETTTRVKDLVRERSAGCVADGPFPKLARRGPVTPNEPIGGQDP